MNRIFKLFLYLFLIANGGLFGQTVALDSFHNPQYQSRIIKYRKLQIGIVGAIGILQLPKAPAARNIEYFEKFGSAAGIHLQYNLKRNAALTLNCLYEQKNWNSSNINYSGNYQKSDNTFHELTFPLLFKYSPFYRNFFVSAGPYLGIILKKEVKGYEEGNYVYQNPFEAGAVLGMGFNIPVSNRISVILEGRDYINVITSKALSDYTKMNTTTFQLGVFYKFGKTEQIEIKKFVDSAWQKQKKVFVKLFYSPQLTYRRDIGDRTRVQGYNSGNSWSSTSYESKEEIPKYGYEIGLVFEFALGKRLNLNTGTSFETQGFKTDSNITTTTSGWGDIIGNFSYTSNNKSFNYSFYYLSIPLIFNYAIKLEEERDFYFGGGVETKNLFRSRLNNSTNYGENSTRFTIFYTVNIGMSFPLQKNRRLFMEPNFKIQNKIYYMSENKIKYQLWSAGCRVGIKF